MARSWTCLLLLYLVASQVDGGGAGAGGCCGGPPPGAKIGIGGPGSIFPGIREPWASMLLIFLTLLTVPVCIFAIFWCCFVKALCFDRDEQPSRSEEQPLSYVSYLHADTKQVPNA